MIPELDLKIFKAITNDKIIGLDFAATHNHQVFDPEIQLFAKLTLDYMKAYKTTPTRRVLNEWAGEAYADKINAIWDKLDSISYDKVEYPFDLDKLKKRFIDGSIAEIKGLCENTNDQNKSIKDIALKLQTIKSIQHGRSFTHKSVKDHVEESEKRYQAKIAEPGLHSDNILTHYSAIDFATGGLKGADLFMIAGETGAGKMLPLNTPIPTPDGFKPMGEIHPGDMVFGRDGKVYTVLAESEVVTASGWRFTLDDKTEIISHEDHLWLTFDRKDMLALNKRTDKVRAHIADKKRVNKNLSEYKPLLKQRKQPPLGNVKTTKTIIETIRLNNGRRNHAIPLAECLELQGKKLLIDPYVFGIWLGDGSKGTGNITSADSEIINHICNAGYKLHKIYNINKNKNGKENKAKTYVFNNLRAHLKTLGVLHDKHIPVDYLFSSKEQRLELLRGLMDSDGYAKSNGSIEFCNTNKKIIDAVAFLIRSLGEACTVSEGVAKLYGREIGPKWRIYTRINNYDVFKLKRKAKRQQIKSISKINRVRYIVKAEKTNPEPMKCIQVSSPDHLYLAGESLIPTHNSTMLMNAGIQIWMQKNRIDTPPSEFTKGHNIIFFSLEMPFEECYGRLVARLARIPERAIADGGLTTEERKRMVAAEKFIKEYPYEFDIVDMPRGVNVETMELRYNEALLRYQPEVAIVDYLGLMQGGTSDQDWLKMGEIAGELHEFGRVYSVAVGTALQLNDIQRGSKTDPKEKSLQYRIGPHRIGRSSMILHHATLGIQIESKPGSEEDEFMSYHIIKNRRGPKLSAKLWKQLDYCTLNDIPYVHNVKKKTNAGADNPEEPQKPDINDISGERLEAARAKIKRIRTGLEEV